MQFQDKMHSQKMEFRDYIEALEEERKKIQVFTKELPLSLELVTQAIEACKQQMCGTMTECNLNGQQSECSEQTSLDEGLVFEEFIPLKKRASTNFDDDEEDDDKENDDDEQNSSHKKMKKDTTTDKKKSDWLRSVQLWNPNPPPPNEEVPRKTSVVELNRNGGAFQPFHKEEISIGKGNESIAGKAATTSAAVTTTSSTSSKKEEKRKQRRCWSQELHKRFLHALQQLGGADSATPKQIREQMNVDGLTNDEVKSHLQKFRLHTRRSPIMHNNANSQTAPLFLVGNIFVQQPQDYTTIANNNTTTTTVSGELTTPGIYAPVATHPPVMKQQRFKQQSHSEERANNHSEGVVLSNSPASSSSTHTPTASHAS